MGTTERASGRMSTRHTPGPWVATDGHPARTNDGEAVIETTGGALIGVCWVLTGGLCGTNQAKANAALIADAPAMLEALGSAAHMLRECGKQLRQHGAQGHARCADRRADAIDTILARHGVQP